MYTNSTDVNLTYDFNRFGQIRISKIFWWWRLFWKQWLDSSLKLLIRTFALICSMKDSYKANVKSHSNITSFNKYESYKKFTQTWTSDWKKIFMNAFEKFFPRLYKNWLLVLVPILGKNLKFRNNKRLTVSRKTLEYSLWIFFEMTNLNSIYKVCNLWIIDVCSSFKYKQCLIQLTNPLFIKSWISVLRSKWHYI